MSFQSCPIRTQAADFGMGSDHGTRHFVAGLVVVEAAVDGAAPFEQAGEPGRVAAHSRGGNAGGAGKNDQATDGVDGRFTENDIAFTDWRRVGLLLKLLKDREVTGVFAGAASHASPGDGAGSAQLGAHRHCAGFAFKVKVHKDGIGSRVGINDARFHEPVYQFREAMQRSLIR